MPDSRDSTSEVRIKGLPPPASMAGIASLPYSFSADSSETERYATTQKPFFTHPPRAFPPPICPPRHLRRVRPPPPNTGTRAAPALVACQLIARAGYER